MLKNIGAIVIALSVISARDSIAQHQNRSSAIINGAVTDFQDRPISDADVIVKDAHFQDVAIASTDAHGRFQLSVGKGRYMALYICKDYAAKNLEFWAWNLIVDGDMAIDARIDGLEVYAINAFLIQRDPSTLQIYFRPMSLARTLKAGGKEKLKSLPFIDIAPRLKTNDIEVLVNGEPVDILQLNRVSENVSKNQEIWAYLMQTSLPKHQEPKLWKICVTLRDVQTEERGEGCLLWERPAIN